MIDCTRPAAVGYNRSMKGAAAGPCGVPHQRWEVEFLKKEKSVIFCWPLTCPLLQMNSQDDNGVMVGNWSNDYSMGKPPTSWTGSTKILLQYANTGVPVCFAQCWVYAGVFNTCKHVLCLLHPASPPQNHLTFNCSNFSIKCYLHSVSTFRLTGPQTT